MIADRIRQATRCVVEHSAVHWYYGCMKSATLFGQKSWVIQTNLVELAVTERGGMMAPVTFFRRDADRIRPYYVAPWAEESIKRIDPPVLGPLRGDFFCLPFGANATGKGTRHTVHGETATERWRMTSNSEDAGGAHLELVMQTRTDPGRVTKRVHVPADQTVIYTEHLLEEFKGTFPFGHHATLQPPEEEGSMLISTSPFRFGMTGPRKDVPFDGGEYYALEPLQRFKSLNKIPTIWKNRDQKWADCTSFPRRRGFVDVISVYAKPDQEFAWTAATVPSQGYVWFALKDPTVLPQTQFWMENHGRHQAPWSGRNFCIGIEDTCGYFAEGLDGSINENPVAKAGVATARTFTPQEPLSVNYIQGIARVPQGFGRVATITRTEDEITLVSTDKQEVTVGCKVGFLKTGKL
jgi:hypothetical protein